MTTQHTGIGWEMQACGWHLDAGDWKVITISQGGVTLQQVWVYEKVESEVQPIPKKSVQFRSNNLSKNF
jgi:hypothetical protein